MKTLPFYENLDTSFVNLAALLRYLRERQFIGQVRVRLNGYQAEITLDARNRMTVEEHDQIAGRIAEGDEVLQRLLIRAREPGGSINVYQFVEGDETSEQKVSVGAAKPIEKPRIEKEFLSFASASNGKKEKISDAALADDFLNLVPRNHSPLPFEFTNRVENRARQTQISAEDWQTLLQIVGELLGAADEVLTNANLNFTTIFAKARAEISGDYPFLNPASGLFFYSNGKAELNEKVSAKLFAASINEALRRVLNELAEDSHFSEVHRDATQKILAILHHRKPLCDRFFITPQLEKILGV